MKLDLVRKLRQITSESANETYKIIANYLLQNSDSINLKKVTIFSLANKVNTSPPTITRFCNHIGIDGFKELMFLLKENGSEYLTKVDEAVLKAENSDRLRIFTKNLVEVLQNTLETNILKIISLKSVMLSAKRIFFFCLGNNNFLVKSLAHLFVRMNINVIYSSSFEQQNSYLNNIEKNDLAIVVSMSLSDPYFKKIKSVCVEKKTKTLFITNNYNSEILVGTDPNLVLCIGESDDKLGRRFNSELGIMYVLKMILLEMSDIENLSMININSFG